MGERAVELSEETVLGVVGNKATLWQICSKLVQFPGELVAKVLRKLVNEGKVSTDIDSNLINPFDATFQKIQQ